MTDIQTVVPAHEAAMDQITFQPTNHLKARTSGMKIAYYMGGPIFNASRTDLPTRKQRIYFAPFDEVELLNPNASAHPVSLAGFNAAETGEGAWNRFGTHTLKGYRIEDLKSFVWRARYRDHHFEVRATLTGTGWSVEYLSDCVPGATDTEMVEYKQLLVNWFQMVQPNTLQVQKAATVHLLASIAGEAAHVCNEGMTPGFHSQLYATVAAYADSQGIDVSSSEPYDGAEQLSNCRDWWIEFCMLPEEEEMPSARESDALHQWKLAHISILLGWHGSNLARVLMNSRESTEEQVVEELVAIGTEVFKIIGGAPLFSFQPYLYAINWQPVTVDADRTERILEEASRRLGWTMQ